MSLTKNARLWRDCKASTRSSRSSASTRSTSSAGSKSSRLSAADGEFSQPLQLSAHELQAAAEQSVGRETVQYYLDGLSLAKSVQSRRRCSRSLFELSCRGLAKPLSELALPALLTAAAAETDVVTATGLIAAATKLIQAGKWQLKDEDTAALLCRVVTATTAWREEQRRPAAIRMAPSTQKRPLATPLPSRPQAISGDGGAGDWRAKRRKKNAVATAAAAAAAVGIVKQGEAVTEAEHAMLDEPLVEDFEAIEWLNDDATLQSLLRLLRVQCECAALPHALALALCVHTISPPPEQSSSQEPGELGADPEIEGDTLGECDDDDGDVDDESAAPTFMPDALREEGALDCLIDNLSWSLASDAGRGHVVAWMSLAILEEALYKNAENKEYLSRTRLVHCLNECCTPSPSIWSAVASTRPASSNPEQSNCKPFFSELPTHAVHDLDVFVAAARTTVNLTNSREGGAARVVGSQLFHTLIRTSIECWCTWNALRERSDERVVKQILKVVVGHLTAVANCLEVVPAARDTIASSPIHCLSSAVLARWFNETDVPHECLPDGGLEAVKDFSWLRFFALMLHMQCHSFVQDLEASDDSHSHEGATNGTAERKEEPTGAATGAALPADAGVEEGFPAEQLMVAAYLSLILSCFAEHAAIPSVLAALPQANWWLPTRVLKAYVVMQNQTGSLNAELLTPIVEALARVQALHVEPLREQRNDAQAAAPGEATCGKPAKTESQCETSLDDWLSNPALWEKPKRNAVDSSASKRPSNWRWNGRTFVWVGRSEEDQAETR